jgi:hypothetical protein
MKLRIFTILILSLIITAQPLKGELIFLNDGTIIEGKITSDIEESITVEDKDSIFYEIQRSDILKISQSGKVYIQKRNGEGISAYIIDEDKTFYTLITELDDADEFTIKKSDILFISNLTPANVKGESESSAIYLTWTKPAVSVKYYKVYYSTGKNEKYKLDGTTTDNSYALKNVLNNKTYYIIVTSIGMDGSESPPSNELKLTVNWAVDDYAEPEEPVAQNKTIDRFKFAMSVKPFYINPHGGLKEIFDYGFGASLGFSYYSFLFINNAILSFETGYLKWEKDYERTGSGMYMLPFTLSIGYRFNFTENFSLLVLAGGGKIYLSKDCYLAVVGDKKKPSLETLFSGSMNLDCITSENFSFFVGGGFYSIYKKDKDIDKKYWYKKFAEYQMGVSYRLR